MKALSFGVNWRDTKKKGSHYKVVDQQGMVADYVETVLDSVLLTRKEVEELLKYMVGIGYAFGLTNTPYDEAERLTKQKISSIIKKEG